MSMTEYTGYWRELEATAVEVSKWPEWKRGGVSVMNGMTCSKIIDAIGPDVTRNDIAKMYAELITTTPGPWEEGVDKVNAAIVRRWSRAGLTYIKRRAWDICIGKYIGKQKARLTDGPSG